MRAFTMAGTVFFSLTFAISLSAQAAEPDPFGEYEAFLAQHQDMTTSDLLVMHPAGAFQEKVGLPWESVVHGDVVEVACNLTQDEKSLLQNNGFVVTEMFRESRFIDQMVFVWNHDLPLFISTDAILHALGVSYDRILADLETGMLTSRLSTLLSGMHGKLPALAARYAADSRMAQMLRDVDVYLTAARKLLGQTVTPCYPDNAAEISRIISLIQARQLASYALFSTSCKEIDFSQFTPRGHYADALTLYFRGQADNGQGRPYVGIEDLAGHVAVATHPRADAVCIAYWQKWQILLADLRAAGVDVATVRKMVIGVGNLKNPQPGGSGRIYIDDIRLTKQMP